METTQDVAALVASDEELQEAAQRVGAGEIRGAVLLDPSALKTMQHAELFATAIFNPFGPTVETVSLASFDGNWHKGRVLLLRRSLNPFADADVQVLSFYPGLRESWDYIGGDVSGELVVPDPTDAAPWFEDFESAPSFDRWWRLATHDYYQTQLYLQLPGAWSGASGQLPRLMEAMGVEGDDFSAWWGLFRPAEVDSSSPSQ